MNYCVTAFTKDLKPLRKGCEGDTKKNQHHFLPLLQRAVITSGALCARHCKYLARERSCAKELIARQASAGMGEASESLSALQPAPCAHRLTPGAATKQTELCSTLAFHTAPGHWSDRGLFAKLTWKVSLQRARRLACTERAVEEPPWLSSSYLCRAYPIQVVGRVIVRFCSFGNESLCSPG